MMNNTKLLTRHLYIFLSKIIRLIQSNEMLGNLSVCMIITINVLDRFYRIDY